MKLNDLINLFTSDTPIKIMNARQTIYTGTSNLFKVNYKVAGNKLNAIGFYPVEDYYNIIVE